jgi:hypothetical protein
MWGGGAQGEPGRPLIDVSGRSEEFELRSKGLSRCLARTRNVEVGAAGNQGGRVNVFDELNARHLWDFIIKSYDGDSETLTILASTDFTYRHEAEIRFHGVHFVGCSTFFCHALFDIASEEQRAKVLAPLAEGGDHVIVFRITAEHGTDDSPTYFIAAERMECTIATVCYWK